MLVLKRYHIFTYNVYLLDYGQQAMFAFPFPDMHVKFGQLLHQCYDFRE